MSNSEKMAWEAVRNRGKNKFIIGGLWRRGFKVAMPFMVGFLVIDINHHLVRNIPSEIGFLVIGYVILSLAAGWCEGEIVWFKTERDYKRFTFRNSKNLRTRH
jgi:hypothetical protein